MLGILKNHPELRPYESDLKLRMELYKAKKRQMKIQKFCTQKKPPVAGAEMLARHRAPRIMRNKISFSFNG